MTGDIRQLDPRDEALTNQYEKWQKAHSKMKQTPPAEGRDYIKHANNLLALLEGVAEANPIAKAVVSSFRNAIVYEQERRENDARVAAVYLAQSDMMSVLLDVNALAMHRHNQSPDAENPEPTVQLGTILLRIDKEIKSCANSIETYYKEARLVKFWKAQEWKKMILGHIEQFGKYRAQLQTTLQIQMASRVDTLIVKMDVVLSNLFTPKLDWEKNLDRKIRTLGPPEKWINDDATLQSLISESQDTSFAFASTPGQSASKDAEKSKNAFAMDALLTKVKKELQASVKTLCEQNKEMFDIKLTFHAQQIEQSIATSTQMVIKTLQGPYDRLFHEDLRHLWKEMSWIFCVDNKLFVTAVFEFYLDQFSGTKHIKQGSHADQVSDKGHESIPDANTQTTSIAGPAYKAGSLSRIGSARHPDSWTLDYIVLYGDYIIQAIDNDNSGFIRISEANKFTQAIPKGWNLPQWCAYCAAGWAYEARIYRMRISKLLSTLMEMQARVLGSNRTCLFIFTGLEFEYFCYAVCREPTGQNIPITAAELRDLVKQKIIDQDQLYREHLKSLKWNLEDQSTVRLLYGDKDPEKYILQLCTLMLEQTLALARACSTATVDIREWIRLFTAFDVMKTIVADRITKLEAGFNGNNSSGQSLNSYYGGIWSYFNKEVPYSLQEVIHADALSDQSLYVDFPLSQITAAEAYIQFSTWEAYVKSSKKSDIPSSIPLTWDPALEAQLKDDSMNRTTLSQFPHQRDCNRCNKKLVNEKYYRCISPVCRSEVLEGTDFCDRCHNLPAEQHNVEQHTIRHPIILFALELLPPQEERLGLEVVIVFERLAQRFSAQDRSDYTTSAKHAKNGVELDNAIEEDDFFDSVAREFDGAIPENESDSEFDFEKAPNRDKPRPYIPSAPMAINCTMCTKAIQVESEFFKCIGHSCIDQYFCRTCVINRPRREVPGDDTHQWWHSLLCLRKDLILKHWDVMATSQTGDSDTSRTVQSPSDALHVRMGKLEERLEAINSSLEERVKSLESKIDSMVVGLHRLFDGHSTPGAPPGIIRNQSHQAQDVVSSQPRTKDLHSPSSRAISNNSHVQDTSPNHRSVPQQGQDRGYHDQEQQQQIRQMQHAYEHKDHPEQKEDPEDPEDERPSHEESSEPKEDHEEDKELPEPQEDHDEDLRPSREEYQEPEDDPNPEEAVYRRYSGPEDDPDRDGPEDEPQHREEREDEPNWFGKEAGDDPEDEPQHREEREDEPNWFGKEAEDDPEDEPQHCEEMEDEPHWFGNAANNFSEEVGEPGEDDNDY